MTVDIGFIIAVAIFAIIDLIITLNLISENKTLRFELENAKTANNALRVTNFDLMQDLYIEEEEQEEAEANG